MRHDFRLRPGPCPLIDRLDITVAAGSRGSGREQRQRQALTIAKLVMGELRPWSGRVELDGVPAPGYRERFEQAGWPTCRSTPALRRNHQRQPDTVGRVHLRWAVATRCCCRMHR